MKCFCFPAKKNLPCTRIGAGTTTCGASVGEARAAISSISTVAISLAPWGRTAMTEPGAGGARTTGVKKFHCTGPRGNPSPLFFSCGNLPPGAALVPGKSRSNDRPKVRVLRPPAEPLGRKARIGDEHRRIARPPRGLAPGDRPPADRLGRSDHFAHRMASPGTKVGRHGFAAGAQMLERAQMSLGEIADVRVVAHRRSVRGRIIGPVDVHMRAL